MPICITISWPSKLFFGHLKCVVEESVQVWKIVMDMENHSYGLERWVMMGCLKDVVPPFQGQQGKYASRK